jgi:hypothetical protein
MTAHMGECRVLVLWSECDQCGTPAEFRARGETSDPRLREIRDEWNRHHGTCSTADGVRVEEFPVPQHWNGDEPEAEITYI